MDTQILADRLAALEAHLLQLDQRVDALGNPGPGDEARAEAAALREEMSGWRTETAERLGNLDGRLTEAEGLTRETLEREAELLESLALAILPPEPENSDQTPGAPEDQGNPEPILPEPNPSPSPSRRWWETILGG